jgi:hypothetical protein
MDVDVSNIDSSATTGSTNPSSSGGLLFTDQGNPFGNTTNNQWDFGNASFVKM